MLAMVVSTGTASARMKDRDGNRVLVHIQTEVRSVDDGGSTSVCPPSAAHTARDPQFFTDG